jgi:RNA polymerase sigma factor (sigma-70 family)
MAKATVADLIFHLRKTWATQGARELTDSQLLNLFLDQREEIAFAVLVHRHGPMVLDVCRRVLGDSHSAEDAFQATFMVLCRRSRSIRRRDSLGSWLFGVAKHIAAKDKARMNSRRNRERLVAEQSTRCGPVSGLGQVADEQARAELRLLVDDEIGRLPDKFVAPVVLCWMEGKSHEQAPKELGWAKGTLTSRLMRARELLRQRLLQRGVELTGAAGALVLGEQTAKAVVPAPLIIHTTKAATALVNGSTLTAAGVSAEAIAMAEEAVRAGAAIKIKLMVILLTFGIACGGGGWAAYHGFGEKASTTQASAGTQPPQTNSDKPALKEPPRRVDLYGDPLPEGAIARLGTSNFRVPLFATIAYALGDKVIVSGSRAGIQFWDAATGKPINLFKGDGKGMLAISADGNTLITNAFEVIDMATAKQICRLQGWNGAAALSPDGRIAAISSRTEAGTGVWKVVLWDVATGKEIHSQLATGFHSLAFSPNGKTLAACNFTDGVRLSDVDSGKELIKLNIKDSQSVVFAPDGKTLASFANYPTGSIVRIWDVKSGAVVHSLKGTEGNRFAVYTPDGKSLATTDDWGFIRIWDAAMGKEIRRWQTPADNGGYSQSFTSDGKILATVVGSAIVRWDFATGKELDPAIGHRGQIDSLEFAADGKSLFSSSTRWDGALVEWDLASLREKNRLVAGPFQDVGKNWTGYVRDHTRDWQYAVLDGLYFGPKKDTLASHVDPVVRLWNLRTGIEVRGFPGHELAQSAMFSYDGKYLLTLAREGARLWEVATGRQLHYWKEALLNQAKFAFAPDSQWLAVGRLDGTPTIRLFSMLDVKEIRAWDIQEGNISGISISPDGKLLACSSVTKGGGPQASIWEVDSGKQLGKSILQGANLQASSFSADGRILAAIHGQRSDSTIRLWEVISGQQIRQIPLGTSWMTSLAFSPNGRTLASGGPDSCILLWDLVNRQTDRKPAVQTRAELETLWTDLSKDAAEAYRAIWDLVLAPDVSTPFLKERLKPVIPLPAALIADLDSDRFAVRDKAVKTLEAQGEAAEDAIRKALQAKPTLEARRRLESIVDRIEQPGGYVFQKLRAIAALEYIGTAQAKEVLQGLVIAPNPRVAEAAAMSLRRLAKGR